MFEGVTALLAQYRGMLQDAVGQCDEAAQALLTPAIDVALEGIENICPLVGVENPEGGPPMLHWGPEGVAEAKLVILAATPDKVMVMRAEEWIEPLDLPASVPPAALWAIIGRGVAESNGHSVAVGLVSRLAAAGTWDTVQDWMAQARADGLTPVLVTMVSVVEDVCAGVCTMVVLPADVAVQVAQTEAEVMGLARMN
jgi:hypothetical protein